MKKKSIIKIISLLIIVISVFIILYQYLTVKNTYKIIFDYETRGQKSQLVESIKNKDFLVCNWNIFNPEVAFVYENYNKKFNKTSYEIGFYNFKKQNILFGKWNYEYTGGTTISNTTFPQLLKMVKEDCYQFQINGKKDNISWVYMEYNREEEERREKERIEEEKRAIEEMKKRKPLSKEEKERLLKKHEEMTRELEEELLKESRE